MPRNEPALPEIEQAVRTLPHEQELAQLATLASDGFPSASVMHIAADGLVAYMGVFVRSRKYQQMQADPRVSYAVSHLPPGGYDDRFAVRTLQFRAHASLVTDAAEIAHAVDLCLEQFPWATAATFNSARPPEAGARQAFFRLDPIEAVWADHSVGLLWRVILQYAPDGSHLSGSRPYDQELIAP